MVAIYLAPAYLAVCAYILFRTIHWIQVLHFSECLGVQRDWTDLFFCCVQYPDRIHGTDLGISEIYEAFE